MGLELLWIESLAAALLVVASVAACSGRWTSRLGQGVPPVLVALLLVALGSAYSWGVQVLRERGALTDYPVRYAYSWTVAVALGSLVVLVLALRRAAPEEPPVARDWPRARLAVALGALLVVVYITFTNLDLAVKVEMAAVRAEAGARAQALAPPRVPDRDNAALTYQQAFEALTPRDKIPASQRDRWFLRGWEDSPGPRIDPRSDELRKFLASQRRGLMLLRKAASMPDCRFGHDYQEGFSLLLHEPERMRDGARLLLLGALLQAHAGNALAAFQDVALVFRMAKHLNDPTLITFLGARALERDGTRTLEQVLALVPARGEDLAPLLAEGETHAREGLLRALRMEEAAASGLFASLADSSSGPQGLDAILGPSSADRRFGTWILRSSFYRVFFLSDDLAAYRRAMRRYQEVVARPYFQAQRELDQVEQAFRAHQGGILTRLMMPAIVKCAQMAAMAEAYRELRRLALAVSAYRARTGKFPERPDVLMTDHLARVPVDPFDGQPLRMKRDGKDLVLYSIGPDLRDDGGTPNDPTTREGDLVFRLRGPDRAPK